MLPRAVMLTVCVTLIPLPVAAGETVKATKTPALQAAMSKIVASDLAARKETRGAAPRKQDTTTPGADSPAFFKTPAGMIILGVVAVGAGYAIYSTQHDRITSPAKK